jgi:hypothetical protein
MSFGALVLLRVDGDVSCNDDHGCVAGVPKRSPQAVAPDETRRCRAPDDVLSTAQAASGQALVELGVTGPAWVSVTFRAGDFSALASTMATGPLTLEEMKPPQLARYGATLAFGWIS